MAKAKVMKSGGLLSKLGDKAAKIHEKIKGEDTKYGNVDLPTGIQNGIAKLSEAKFDVYKKGDNEGEPYFYAAGVVVEPKKHDGIPIEGLRTSIMVPVCETKNKSLEENLSKLYNELRKLGLDTSTMELDDLEPNVEILKEAAPHFRFRTWSGEATAQYPNPRVNHDWSGVVDFEETEATEEAVEDNTEVAEPEEEATSPDGLPVVELTVKQIEGLVRKANKGDEEAQQELNNAALAKGKEQDEIDAAAGWQEVADMLLEEAEDDTATQEDTPAELEPSIGDTYNYFPIDPKTKKAVKKAVEVEVTAIDKKTGALTLKNLSNAKVVYKGISVDDISAIE